VTPLVRIDAAHLALNFIFRFRLKIKCFESLQH